MYGLPDNFDSTTFVGCEFELLTFASNAILLVFAGGQSLSISRQLSYQVDKAADMRTDVLPVTESGLPALLGQSVERVEVQAPGDLLLYFESGAFLLIEDSDQHYESYAIRTPSGEIFV